MKVVFMHPTQFARIVAQKSPLVVEFWAPWCTPCKQMAPSLEAVSKEYSDKVELVRINADDSPELARSLKVFSIPAMLVYREGSEISRKVGVLSRSDLSKLFEYAYLGSSVRIDELSNKDRMIRLIAAVGLLLLAGFTGFHPILLAASGLIFFFAIYDRCPIWKAITGYIKPKQNPNTKLE